jgi:hypothetical protein
VRIAVAVAGAVAGIVLVAACGSSPAKVTASVTGGTKAERSLAREILARLAPSPVTSVRFRGLQHDAIHHWPGRRMDVSHSPDSVQADWEESIFAYSYALLARARRIPIGFVSLDIGNGSLDNALADAPRTPIGDSQLHSYEAELRAAADSAHSSIAFRELRPGTVALEATVTAKRPEVLIKYHLRRFYDLWQHRPNGLLGFLLSVEGPTREVALAEGASPSGWTGTNRYLACTSLWSFSTPRRLVIPPCPV